MKASQVDLVQRQAAIRIQAAIRARSSRLQKSPKTFSDLGDGPLGVVASFMGPRDLQSYSAVDHACQEVAFQALE